MTRFLNLMLAMALCFSAQGVTAQDKGKDKMIGPFVLSLTETPNIIHSRWIFTKEGRAIENGKDMGTWTVSGGKTIITYSNKQAGQAVLTFKDDDTLIGKNVWQNGKKVFNWVLKREKTEVAQKPKEEPAAEKAIERDKIAAAEKAKKDAEEKAEQERREATAKIASQIVDKKLIQFDVSNAKPMGDFVRITPDKAVSTRQSYSGPVDITVIARTNKDNIRLHAFKGGMVIFNWEAKPGDMRVHRPDDIEKETAGSVAVSKSVPLQADRWHTLFWKIREDGMEVLVDGKVVFSEAHKYDLSKACPIRISGALGSVVDVRYAKVVSLGSVIAAEKKRAEEEAERQRQLAARQEAGEKAEKERLVAEWNKMPALPGVDGKNHSLSEYKKDVVVMCFLRNSCPVSQGHEDKIIAFTKKYGDKVDFVAIYVGNGERDRLPKIKEKNFNFPCLYDENKAVARSLSAKVTPHFFVFNKNRKLIYQGAMTDKIGEPKVFYLDAAVEAVLKGGTPAVPYTKANGCSIWGMQ